MANGFFQGGFASGMESAEKNTIAERARTLAETANTQDVGLRTRALDIQQQAQANTEKQQIVTQIDKQISATMGIVAETIKAGIENGKDPAVIQKAVGPLLDSAKQLAMKAGRDPASLDAQVTAQFANPGEAASKPITTGESLTGVKSFGVFDPKTKTIVPVPVGTPGAVPIVQAGADAASPAPPALTASTPPGSSGYVAPPKSMNLTDTDPQPAPAASTTVSGGGGTGALIGGPGVPAAPPVNEEFLNTLPEDVRPTIKQLVNYEIRPGDISIKGNQRTKLLAIAKLYDPEYDPALAAARHAAIKEFAAGGSTSPAAQITAGNTAILHANEMGVAAEKLKELPGNLSKIANSGIPIVSYAAAQLKNKLVQGTPEGQALAEFMVAKQHFSEEVTKFYSGSQGSEAERERALKNLDEAKSITELRAAIHQESKLMADKISALQDRFKNANGPRAWMSAIQRLGGDYPIIQEQSRRALDEIGGRVAMPATPAAPAAAKPAAGGGWSVQKVP